jgi:uncharacterized membrane protein YfcA
VEVLILSGLLVGFIAGFFGVGGGTVLVPILMMTGYSIQEAVGMAVVQMLISSSVGSFLNHKKNKIDVKTLSFLGIGGLIGGSLSPYVVLHTSSTFLEALFFSFILIALIKFFYTPHGGKASFKVSKTFFIFVGFMIALPSSSIGMGGAILLTPFLHAFMGYELKKATAASLFFVLFSAFAGTVSWAFTGELLYKEGLILGISSIFGVWLGLFGSHKIEVRILKKLLLILYIAIFVYITKKLFFG